MSGVRVGTVKTIRLPTNPDTQGIEVVVMVDEAYAARVRNDSTAALRILQMLSGEKYVDIAPGSPDQPQLPELSVIGLSQDPELLEQAAAAAENLTEIGGSLKNILHDLEEGNGLLGRMINDPEFGTEGLESFNESLANLRVISDDLLRGRGDAPGFIGRVLYDEEFAGRVDELGRAIAHLTRVVESIDPARGALGALTQEGGTGQQAMEDLRVAAASLRRVTEALEAPDGLLGRLIHDPEYSTGLARDLETILGNLAEISDKLNRGDGTLGALINDPELHESMQQVVAGLNDSKFARWLMRRYQKKGIEAEEAERTD
jgi:phospholipid/cholesterol/gamma-HCH transport system substrate-binding protein